MKAIPLMAIFAIVLATTVAASSTRAEAKRSSCDGIHRCICGSTQARYFGFPRMVNGRNLWQASEWAHAFERTSLRAGVVAVEPHHVYRIVQPTGPGRAIVADEKGQYERRIRTSVFVDPNGSRAFAKAESPRQRVTRRHRSYPHPQMASFDRLTNH